eukprot:gb/GEZN01003577.1/.p1 GENE.gb/GEZN01003577.1/~~gb/GEZN01003577.1/.p1  ORF type:complete len:541 (-),score=78.99 gb/GEZN01003577.1/:455-2077(-)
MGEYSYVALTEERPHGLGAALVGVTGLVLTLAGSAGWALFQSKKHVLFHQDASKNIPFSTQGQDGPSSEFFPKEGLENVMVKPGKPPWSFWQSLPRGVSKMMAAAFGTQPSCLFLYSSLTTIPTEFTTGSTLSEEAWLYGAEVFTCDEQEENNGEKDVIAVLTGELGAVVKGRLLCFPASVFKEKLAAADQMFAFDPSTPERGLLRRRTAKVVKKDGSSVQAIWYFQLGVFHYTNFSEDRSFPGRRSFERRIVLVTGANKGIGYEIAKSLLAKAKKEQLLILLGARDPLRGQEALKKLRAEVSPDERTRIKTITLDVDSDSSVRKAAELVNKTYGGLDILINNAGRAWKGNAFDRKVAASTIGTNYFGVLRVTQAFLPLLRKASYPRVVNLSSMAGSSALRRMAKPLQAAFLAEDLTIPQLTKLMQQFIQDVGEGRSDARGWPHSTYGVSKAGCSMLTRVLARDEQARNQSEHLEYGKEGKVLINACCPGWCRTDMAGPSAPRSAAQGAVTPVLLALLPPDSETTGTFWQDGRQSPSWLS